jgi:arylsulfatase A-like enzyme
VIYVMCDQLPFDALGCYGHPLARTPSIDSLAASGVRFTNAFSQNPVSVPSRASQLTGLYPARHGLLDNACNLEIMHPWAKTLTDAFAEAGYATAHFGKWHAGRKHTECRWTEFAFLEETVGIWPQSSLERFRGAGPVFLAYDGLVHAATHPCEAPNTGPARITDRALDFLDRFAYRPFFLRVSYLGPHSPVLVPKPFDEMYDPADVEIPDWPREELAGRPARVRRFQETCIANRARDLGETTAEGAVRTHVAYSLGLVSHVDAEIGRILHKVDALGLRGNTIVVFTTDHGAFWGEWGLLEKSIVTHYRRLLQIPLIFSCPGLLPEGGEVAGFVEEVDVMPTLLDLAGVGLGHRTNGRSVRAALLGDESACRRDVFAESTDSGDGYSVASLRDAEWHFVWHSPACLLRGAGRPTGEAELFSMTDDPDERHSLADAGHRDVIEAMKARLMGRILEARRADLLPEEPYLGRSPIHLAPGYDEKGHAEAMIRLHRGESCEEFPARQEGGR